MVLILYHIYQIVQNLLLKNRQLADLGSGGGGWARTNDQAVMSRLL
jgi:hypothetical protein